MMMYRVLHAGRKGKSHSAIYLVIGKDVPSYAHYDDISPEIDYYQFRAVIAGIGGARQQRHY